MTRTKSSLLCLLAATAIALPLLGAHEAVAEAWVEFSSKAGFYKVRMPEELKNERKAFRIDQNSLVYNEETIAIIDQRPYKDVVKTYIVKYEQTIGTEFTKGETVALLNRELDIYIDHYMAMEGVLKKREMIAEGIAGFPAGEILITYKDPDYGNQDLRSRVIMTESGKFQQIALGPTGSAFSIDSKNYFDSFKPFSGVEARPGALEEKWKKYTSPLMLSTYYLPPTSPVFMPDEPSINQTANSEVMKVTFNDPARDQKLFYNIYGYRVDRPMKMEDAQNLLFKRHMGKYVPSSEGLKMHRGVENEIVTYTLEGPMPAPKNLPYVRYLRIKMQFIGTYMVVQEIVGDTPLVKSKFADNLTRMFSFHPRQAHEFYKKLKEGGAPAAPDAPKAEAPAPQKAAPKPKAK